MPSLVNIYYPVTGGPRLYSWFIIVFPPGSEGSGIPVLKGFMVVPVIRICGLHLYKYLSFTLLVNAAWLDKVYVVVAAPIIPAMGCLVVYFLIYLDMSSIGLFQLHTRISFLSLRAKDLRTSLLMMITRSFLLSFT